MKIFNRNELIFREGDPADCMFDIISGSVGIYIGYGTEDENQLAVLHAGHLLGEMGLIDGYPRSAAAVAMEDGTALEEIDVREFADYFSDRPERVLEIMRQLSARLRRQTQDYMAACRILESLSETQDEPSKRPKALKDEVKKLMDDYNTTMNLVAKYAGSGAFFPLYPDQF